MPEEINRVLSDHISELLFAPTEAAVENLHREGIADDKIHLVGDVMFDAARFYGSRVREGLLAQLDLQSKQYILATIHRAENTDEPARLRGVFEGLAAAAAALPVILPLHPRTRAALQREKLLDRMPARLKLVDPLGYLDMVLLEKHARLIATDSGGVQKEAFFQGVPCVTLREETEWVELVQLGWNRLVAPRDAATVRDGVLAALADPGQRETPPDLYGGGEASGRIVHLLRKAG
jgi:UDP-GlcNAc3NAcA epimerase